MTVPQMRALFTELQREAAAEAERIEDVVSEVLPPSEEARIYHWYKAKGQYPPRSPRPGPRQRRQTPSGQVEQSNYRIRQVGSAWPWR